MTVLKDVSLYWAKLDPKNPNKSFDPQKPVWEVKVVTEDKAVAKEWKDLKLNVKTEEKDSKVQYYSYLKRRATYEKTGDPNQPVKVVDGQLMPLEPNSIGNGSVGNVQIKQWPWKFAGKEGISTEIVAIQVTKLVEFNAGNGLAFEEIGETEVISAEAVEQASEDDLWN